MIKLNFEDLLYWNNIILRYENIPSTIRGFAYCNNNNYLVIINARLCHTQQEKTVIHELIHIFENHFSYDARSVEKCEQEVKEIIKNIKLTLPERI